MARWSENLFSSSTRRTQPTRGRKIEKPVCQGFPVAKSQIVGRLVTIHNVSGSMAAILVSLCPILIDDYDLQSTPDRSD